jgi:nitroimidazol reductase NimA-like FMN-containing flavoprotein (pyridoxamine 5'-phosphate oxidase superfamily)
MEQIRYQARICSDQAKIAGFLSRARVGVLAMSGEEYPYAVPVNFVWKDGTVYFHGLGSGKKYDSLLPGPGVCFTVYEEFGTVTDPVPCHADTAYFSVVMFGKAEKVTDSAEGAEALSLILDKFMPGFYERKISGQLVEKYRSAMDGNAVGIFRIQVKEMTAKENAAAPASLFAGKDLDGN